MLYVKQRILHNPPETYGDCHRAAMSYLTEIPYDNVPHFMHGLSNNEGEIFNKRQDAWLSSIGLAAIVFPVMVDKLEDVFTCAKYWNPGRPFLLGGECQKGIGHTVVADQTGILHDPHPRNIGITDPMSSDGCYWLTYIMSELNTQAK